MKRASWVCSLLTVVSGLAADWAQWRGPEFNGSSPETGLPAAWTKAEAKWVVDMPGPTASTPVIFGDRVFASTIDAKNQTLHALCVDRASGKVLWDKKTGDGDRKSVV